MRNFQTETKTVNSTMRVNAVPTYKKFIFESKFTD